VQAHYAAQISGGQLPFRDFVSEYPPLALIFSTVPAIFESSLRHYYVIFRGLCCIADCLIWMLILRANHNRPFQSLLYILCSTALGPLLYDRLDLILGGLLLVTIRAIAKKDYNLGAFTTGAGIAFKIIPVIWVPVLIASAWKRGLRSLGQTVLWLVFPTFLSVGLVIILGGYRFDELYRYHADRGIQLESGPASIEMIMMMFGFKGFVTYEFGSFNLHGTMEPVLKLACSILISLTVIFAGIWVLTRRMTAALEQLLLIYVFAIALILSKVLSPQYFLALLPALIVAPPVSKRWIRVSQWWLVLLLYVITGIIYPWMYEGLVALQPTQTILVIIRNECLAVLSCVGLFCVANEAVVEKAYLPIAAAH
jgi:hypothetical protein